MSDWEEKRRHPRFDPSGVCTATFKVERELFIATMNDASEGGIGFQLAKGDQIPKFEKGQILDFEANTSSGRVCFKGIVRWHRLSDEIFTFGIQFDESVDEMTIHSILGSSG